MLCLNVRSFGDRQKRVVSLMFNYLKKKEMKCGSPLTASVDRKSDKREKVMKATGLTVDVHRFSRPLNTSASSLNIPS